ncbi:hypothetical protein AVEN_94970-1 [Araneus ventricosus]|uniref:Retrotransposon gag domain-containing protein n=1 Tax=Araneus ventricosus TaxID=182803 RepID=A0A4Y2W463_ARAVE|nr:hypothetical protein AVEN_94970-1 [Araneus ventricosus]
MDAFRPPTPLKFSIGNMKEKWRKWRQELENYLLATEKDERVDKIKIAILLNLLGSEGLEIFNTFKFEPPLSQKNYSEVLKKFEECCSLRQNVVYERYKFFSCVQQEGQAIECYVTQLKTLASTCEFEEQENVLIRDRIVLGIRDSRLKERLLHESGLGLEKAIEIVRTAETSREQLRSMKEETVATVSSVKRNRRQNQRNSRHKSTSAKSVVESTSLASVQHMERCALNVIRKTILLLNVSRTQRTHMKWTAEFPDEPYHITLKDDAIPVIHPPRRVPQALQPKLKETLDKLEKEKIVSKVNKPTDWVQSLVMVEKPNGNLRYV